MQAAFTLATAAASFERCVRIDLDGTPHWSHAEQHACYQGEAEGECQNGAVDGDVLDPGNIARIHCADYVQARSSNQEARGSSEDSQENTFGKQLTRETLPACAQSGADGHLLLARRGTSEQEVGNVGTGDEQDERHRPQQDEQRAANVSQDRKS